MLDQATSGKQTDLALFIALLLCLLSACSEQDRSHIRAVLDARDTAVSNHDIKAYSNLLMPGYKSNDQNESESINKMRKLFGQFETIEMKSNNRTIRLIDKKHAECEQSYLLRVRVDGTWRQLNQRERINLTKTTSGWKISGGL